MKKEARTATYIAVGVVVVLFIAACVLSWTISRISNDPTEVGHLWFDALAFVASGFGLVALVWTLHEQRKLTQSQERAVIEVVGASLYFHPVQFEPGYTFELGVYNSGRTHAINVRLKGEISWHPSVNEDNVADGEIVREPIDAYCDQVNPQSIGVLSDRSTTDIEPRRIWNATFGSGGPTIGTEHSQNEHIVFRGHLTYCDVFERKHTYGHVSFVVYSIKSGMPAEIDLTDSEPTHRYDQMRKK